MSAYRTDVGAEGGTFADLPATGLARSQDNLRTHGAKPKLYIGASDFSYARSADGDAALAQGPILFIGLRSKAAATLLHGTAELRLGAPDRAPRPGVDPFDEREVHDFFTSAPLTIADPGAPPLARRVSARAPWTEKNLALIESGALGVFLFGVLRYQTAAAAIRERGFCFKFRRALRSAHDFVAERRRGAQLDFDRPIRG